MKVDNVNRVGVSGIKSFACDNAVQNHSVCHPQITELSNFSYKPISFGRTWAEHKSWGASVNPKTKSVNFKLLTFPDAKKVTVTVLKKDDEKKSKTFELEKQEGGIFQTKKPLPSKLVSNGDKYYFTVYKSDGNTEIVKDPYSFKQDTLLGPSTVYDHSLYNWSDGDWYKNNPDRISRLANSKNQLKSLNEAKIYELNTATISKDGTFNGVKDVIDKIKPMGFNSIEIMPVENTYSFNWGYDGVDKVAVAEHLGGPDKLKDLIDYAHNQGINVIMDIVPNHIGPDGAALHRTGPYIKGPNPFGSALNFEGENSQYVRDYIVNAAINWIDNYHCDGLRLDMTKFMESDVTMKQIAKELNYHCPDAFLIAEDGRNDERVTRPLTDVDSDLNSHINSINNITDTNLDNLGFNSEWAFPYYHALKDAVYGSSDIEALNEACNNSQHNVKYVMSHDEIGNFEGSRLIPKLMVPMLNLNNNVVLNDKDFERAEKLSIKNGTDFDSAKQTVIFQKAQLTSEKLAIMLQTGQLDKYDTSALDEDEADEINEKFDDEVLQKLGIRENSGITFNMLKVIYDECFSKNKMALVRTYSVPGPKMIFQGDESSDLTPFRFFRQFESIPDEDYLYVEKGYQYGLPALNESKFGNIDYSLTARQKMGKYQTLVSDLNKISDENPALTIGHLENDNAVLHPISQVLGTHSVYKDNEIFSVTNFKDASYPRIDATSYYIKFPKGKWVQLLNSDDKKYGGTGRYNNKKVINSDGMNNSPIKLGACSTVLFKKID